MTDARLFLAFMAILVVGLAAAPIMALAGVPNGQISVIVMMTLGFATQAFATWRIAIINSRKTDELANKIIKEISQTDMPPVKDDKP